MNDVLVPIGTSATRAACVLLQPDASARHTRIGEVSSSVVVFSVTWAKSIDMLFLLNISGVQRYG